MLCKLIQSYLTLSFLLKILQVLARGERAIDEGAGDPEEHCGGDGGQDRGSGRNTGDEG